MEVALSRRTKTPVCTLEQQVHHWYEENDNNGSNAITSFDPKEACVAERNATTASSNFIRGL